MSNTVLEDLKQHLNTTPFELDKKYFRLAIQEIERLNGIVDRYKELYPYNDHMLKRID